MVSKNVHVCRVVTKKNVSRQLKKTGPEEVKSEVITSRTKKKDRNEHCAVVVRKDGRKNGGSPKMFIS